MSDLRLITWPEFEHFYTGLRGQPRRAIRFPGGRPSDTSPLLNPAADTDREYASLCVSASTGRNEPCPCDSGRKFKKCCGR